MTIRWRSALGVFCSVVFIAGCSHVPNVIRHEPARVTAGIPLEGVQSVYVSPIDGVGVLPADESGPAKAVGNSSELTTLLRHNLKLNAVQIVDDPMVASYSLDCRIDDLGYVLQESAAESVEYRATLTCSLTDREREKEVWTRSMKEDFTHKTLPTGMTKIPDNPFQHERRLFQYCIIPLWDAMSGSVWAVMAAQDAAIPSS